MGKSFYENRNFGDTEHNSRVERIQNLEGRRKQQKVRKQEAFRPEPGFGVAQGQRPVPS
jgi:hypothetical protein